MTNLLEAAKILGVGPREGRISSAVQYLALVSRGLPVTCLERISDAVAPADVHFKYRIASKATLARLKSKKKLSSDQSVLITRLATMWAQALRVWKSPGEARDFLNRPHPSLEGRRPIDLVFENEIGAQLVEGILGRLEHGSAV